MASPEPNGALLHSLVDHLESVVSRLRSAVVPGPAARSISFLWNPNNPRSFFGPRGYTFFFDSATLQAAALELLNDQAMLLTGMPLPEAEDLLLKFFRYHLHLFVPGAASEPAPPLSTAAQATALRSYISELREAKVYLIPAKRLSVAADLPGRRILFVRPDGDFLAALAHTGLNVPSLRARHFPPFAHEKPEGELTDSDSWIGCISHSDQGAYNLLEALLGAISLLLPLQRSRIFSMAGRNPSIYCLGGPWIARLDGPKFPPLGNDHQLTAADAALLRRLFEERTGDDLQRRLELGLQFVGAGWAPASRFSFLHNAIAFDALFGEQRKVRRSITERVSLLAASVPGIEDRIGRLIDMRNALLHGEISTVESSPAYPGYYEIFGCDPHEDQVRILAACIRSLGETKYLPE